MRVLFLTNMYPKPQLPFYGVFVKNQVEALRRFAPEIEIEVLFIDPKESKWNYVRGLRSLYRRLSEREFHLIHAHHCYMGIIADLQLSVPSLTTLHGEDCIVFFGGALLPFVQKLDRLVCVSERIREEIRRPDAAVIPVGVNCERFKPTDRAECLKTLGWRRECAYVLFPSLPGYALKRYDIFTEAIQRIRNAGVTVEPMHLDGKRSQDEMAVILNAADLMILPSEREGSPMVVKEALMCNTPILAADVGDVRELLEDVSNSELIERDPMTIAEKAVAILKDGNRSDGRKKRDALDEKCTTKRLVEIYKRIAAPGS